MNLNIQNRLLRTAALLLLLSAQACISSDETRTFYLQEDGKIEMVLTHDNVRSSSEKANEKKTEEEKWLREFRTGKLDEIKRLKTAKATEVSHTLLRKNLPYAGVIHGTFKSIDQLAVYLNFSDPKSGVTLELKKSENTRTLIFHVKEKQDKDKKSTPENSSLSKTPREKNLYPIWKFVPEKGTITASSGCKISKSRDSCTLDLELIDQLEAQSKDGEYSIMMTWQLTP